MPEVKLISIIFLYAAVSAEGAGIRLGIIGTDTSHVTAFTKILNDESSPDHVPGGQVVAAYKGGSPDIESSASRVDQYAEELRTKWKVQFVASIPELCRRVDAVLLESVDGRVHLEQARQVIAAHKPLFIDKPLASTLQDAREIARLASAAGVPWFSASSLRFGEIAETMKFADATGVETWGPGPLEPHHQLVSLLVCHSSHRASLYVDGSGLRRSEPHVYAGCRRHRGKVARWPHRYRARLTPVQRLWRGGFSSQANYGKPFAPRR